MERFVRLIVVGGTALVAGLWTVELAAAWSTPWLAGLAVTALAAAALLAGTASELRY